MSLFTSVRRTSEHKNQTLVPHLPRNEGRVKFQDISWNFCFVLTFYKAKIAFWIYWYYLSKSWLSEIHIGYVDKILTISNRHRIYASTYPMWISPPAENICKSAMILSRWGTSWASGYSNVKNSKIPEWIWNSAESNARYIDYCYWEAELRSAQNCQNNFIFSTTKERCQILNATFKFTGIKN